MCIILLLFASSHHRDNNNKKSDFLPKSYNHYFVLNLCVLYNGVMRQKRGVVHCVMNKNDAIHFTHVYVCMCVMWNFDEWLGLTASCDSVTSTHHVHIHVHIEIVFACETQAFSHVIIMGFARQFLTFAWIIVVIMIPIKFIDNIMLNISSFSRLREQQSVSIEINSIMLMIFLYYKAIAMFNVYVFVCVCSNILD